MVCTYICKFDETASMEALPPRKQFVKIRRQSIGTAAISLLEEAFSAVTIEHLSRIIVITKRITKQK